MSQPATEIPPAKILIVDDRAENLFVMEKILKDFSGGLLKARSGQEALSLMLRHDFALVLLDVQMPEMDGFEMAELMRENEKTRDIPIIFITAISKEQKYEFKGYSAGAVDYLFKPLDAHILKSKVNVFVDLHAKNTLIKRRSQEMQEANTMLKDLHKRLEEQNQELQKLDKLKSEFVATVSHELRTPIVGIGAVIANILAGVTGEVSDKVKEYLLMADKDIHRLDRLITELLDFSRIESGNLQLKKSQVDVCALVKNAAQTLKIQIEAKEISLRTHFDKEPHPLYVDGDKIAQVLTNFIHNAVKFTPRGGRIEVVIEVAGNKKETQISVSDTGAGIRPEDIKHVFQRFTQFNRKEGKGSHGSGLGLAICKGIVDAHQGRVYAESAVNKGSKFIFTLPLNKETDNA